MSSSCIYCGKLYKNIELRKRHLQFCHEMHKIQRECIQTPHTTYTNEDEDNDMPSIKQMYSMFQHMLKLLNQQNKKIETLTNALSCKKNLKTNILNWMNDKCNDTKYDSFLEELNSLCISQDDLYLIFELTKLHEGINVILKKFYDSIPRQKRCIRCFRHEKSIFILENTEDNENKWRPITLKDKKDMIRIVHNAILLSFREWRKINKKRIDCEIHFHDKVFLPKMNWLMNSPLHENKIIEGLFKHIAEE